jgi:hypothetical protein
MGAAEKLDRGQRTDCPGTSNDTETTTTAKWKRDHTMTSTPRFALITVVGTLAYLGHAILGWGGFVAFFSHPALVALAIVYFVLFGIALFSGSNLSPGARDDPADRWVVFAFWLTGRWPLICRLIQTGRASGSLTRMAYAGLALFSLPPVASCGSGPSLCLGTASAGW